MEEIVQLAERLKEACVRRGATVATAESCTGGMVGCAITSVAGVSECYKGGFVTYANEAKTALLGVPEEILATVGAVSPECAEAMAKGARERLGATAAVATTGIAGPGGGTPAKPVGLVYIAAATGSGATVTRNLFAGDRDAVRRAATRKALAMLLEAL